MEFEAFTLRHSELWISVSGAAHAIALEGEPLHSFGHESTDFGSWIQVRLAANQPRDPRRGTKFNRAVKTVQVTRDDFR